MILQYKTFFHPKIECTIYYLDKLKGKLQTLNWVAQADKNCNNKKLRNQK